jgi:hypothetical protein
MALQKPADRRPRALSFKTLSRIRFTGYDVMSTAARPAAGGASGVFVIEIRAQTSTPTLM